MSRRNPLPGALPCRYLAYDLTEEAFEGFPEQVEQAHPELHLLYFWILRPRLVVGVGQRWDATACYTIRRGCCEGCRGCGERGGD